MATNPSPFIAELEEALSPKAVHTDEAAILRMLRDNSWLSPLLTAHTHERTQSEGATLGIDGVVTPRTERGVIDACRIAVRHNVAITPRGSGTTNFGLVTPTQGGIILDLRMLRSEPALEQDSIRAAAGTLHGDMERAARSQGRELAILTTTYATATAAGWVVGGHVGLGSSMNGSVWDDIVQELRVVTAEDEPQVLTLKGPETTPLLHTFGAFGIITELVLRTEPVHNWSEAVAFFPTFEEASAFVREISLDTWYAHRVVTAQEEVAMPAFLPLKPVMNPGAGVLAIIDTAQVQSASRLAEKMNGELHEWQSWEIGSSAKPSIATMVYGHRMLWMKRAYPEAAYLHVYFDAATPDSDAAALKRRFGEKLLLEMKYVRSPWMAAQLGLDPDLPVPAAVLTICNGSEPGAVDEVMRFCDDHGIRYQNPHAEALEDNGLITDIAGLASFKEKTDPYALLNPGKLRSARPRGRGEHPAR